MALVIILTHQDAERLGAMGRFRDMSNERFRCRQFLKAVDALLKNSGDLSYEKLEQLRYNKIELEREIEIITLDLNNDIKIKQAMN